MVARRLLGSHLRAGDVLVRLVEVEAYAGLDDPASHAYRGRKIANRTMFGPAGRLYVYVSYGIHRCMNVTCGTEERPAAVLLRAADVLEGSDLVEARRDRTVPRGRLGGPGILCQALGITTDDDGTDLLARDSAIRLEWRRPVDPTTITASPRVGITKAVDWPWRFRIDVAPSRATARTATARTATAARPGGVGRRA